MEHLLAFLSGFIIAGLIGWGSSLLLKSWSIHINPEQPEEELIKAGYSGVITLILLSLSLVVIISLFIFSLQSEWLPYFLLGLFFALLMGFHLQNIYFTYLKFSSLSKVIRQKILLGFKYETLHNQQQSSSKLNEEYPFRKHTPEYQNLDIDTFDRVQKRSSLENLRKEHQRRLQKLKEKEARMGINTPPEILNEIEDIEERIKKLESELAKLRADET